MSGQRINPVADAITTAAEGELHDPSDALRFLDPSQFTVADDGTVDQAAITAAVADLIHRKPHLAAPTAQLTRADLAGMSNADIVQARKDGRLRDMLNPPSSRELTSTELRIRQLEHDGITQLTDADLKTMSRKEIVKAREEGRLTRLLATEG